MIDIYRHKNDRCPLNVFSDRDAVEVDEVVLKTKAIGLPGKLYNYAEPMKPGNYAFGGTFLFTCNGIYPAYRTPIPLHDRDMRLERRTPND